MASLRSWFARLTSPAEIFRPNNCFEIIDNVRVLTPVKYIRQTSFLSSSSYRLLCGRTSL